MNLLSSQRHRTHIFFFLFFAVLIFLVIFLRIVIGPFVLALTLAYVFNPSIEALERRGIRRSSIVVSAIFAAGVFVVLVTWFLVPVIVQQLELLVKMLPTAKLYIEHNWLPKLQILIRQVMGQRDKENSLPQLSDFFEMSSDHSFSILNISNLGQSTKFLASWLVAGLLAPVFAFFIMRDFRQLMLRVLSFVPIDLRGVFLRFSRDVDHTLRAVLRGQLLVISLLSTLYSIAFVSAGLPAGIVVGIATGFARIVPYLDLAVGGTLCFLILVTNSSPAPVVIGVAVSFLIIQILDGIIFTPRIMGQFSGLHPFLIVLSVFCFGDWFGFYGVLLAIPLAAVGRVALVYLLDSYRCSHFYRNASDG